jgi:hypothetical protein
MDNNKNIGNDCGIDNDDDDYRKRRRNDNDNQD